MSIAALEPPKKFRETEMEKCGKEVALDCYAAGFVRVRDTAVCLRQSVANQIVSNKHATPTVHRECGSLNGLKGSMTCAAEAKTHRPDASAADSMSRERNQRTDVRIVIAAIDIA
jgi:hypothetical protein